MAPGDEEAETLERARELIAQTVTLSDIIARAALAPGVAVEARVRALKAAGELRLRAAGELRALARNEPPSPPMYPDLGAALRAG